jgi:GNAT superfamily N-acetyltransferase
MFRLRTPRCDEAAILTELCIRSKAVRGYDEEFMLACCGELTLTASIMQSSSLKVAEIDGHLVGVAQLTVQGELAELNKLFVEPTHLRSGAGKVLFEWATTVARDAGAATMVIEADPDAAGFYRRMGAIDKGTAPSGSIPGRLLPRLGACPDSVRRYVDMESIAGSGLRIRVV